MFGHLPAEGHSPFLFLRRFSFCHHLPLVHGDPSEIPVLNQEPTDHPSQIKSSLGKGRGEGWGLKKAKILLHLKNFERLRIKTGSNDRLKKNLNHLLGGLLIND